MPAAATDRPQPAGSTERFGRPFTFGVDIGGTFLKAAVLDSSGAIVAERVKAPTPKPATPEAVLDAVGALAEQFPAFDRLSIGFPGVVRGGAVVTAPNLGTSSWAGYHLIDAMAARFGVPARLLNDAAVQGLGVVEGNGLECVITLGTGVGCALFRNRKLLLHLEFGQLERTPGENYDRFIGQAGLDAVGLEAWNARVRQSITTITGLTNCDVLYIGGGNARKLEPGLPTHVKTVSNAAGVTGGVRLWEPGMDDFFTGESNAHWPPSPRATP